ncbi:hypothetical protein [uncultured Cohaesibacter sp.]|uniref:hypothetical protein n=1 Tax=uncultured Cohaesibacter sp. TaxID=1002546 RepID=UPI002AA6C42F|nr:hypothetical protein [uncultured Cohaesibacter sp.]
MFELPRELYSASSIAENKHIVPSTSGYDFSFAIKLPSSTETREGPQTLTLLQIGKTGNLRSRITKNHLGNALGSSVLMKKIHDALLENKDGCKVGSMDVSGWILENVYFGWIEDRVSPEGRCALIEHFNPRLNLR